VVTFSDYVGRRVQLKRVGHCLVTAYKTGLTILEVNGVRHVVHQCRKHKLLTRQLLPRLFQRLPGLLKIGGRTSATQDRWQQCRGKQQQQRRRDSRGNDTVCTGLAIVPETDKMQDGTETQ